MPEEKMKKLFVSLLLSLIFVLPAFSANVSTPDKDYSQQYNGYYALAEKLYENGHYKVAIDQYTTAINLIKNTELSIGYELPIMYTKRGTCNFILKNYKEALNDANLAEKYYPPEGKKMMPDIYYLKAVSKIKLNDYKGALNDAKKLKQFATENNDMEYIEVADDLLQAINRIQN